MIGKKSKILGLQTVGFGSLFLANNIEVQASANDGFTYETRENSVLKGEPTARGWDILDGNEKYRLIADGYHSEVSGHYGSVLGGGAPVDKPGCKNILDNYKSKKKHKD